MITLNEHARKANCSDDDSRHCWYVDYKACTLQLSESLLGSTVKKLFQVQQFSLTNMGNRTGLFAILLVVSLCFVYSTADDPNQILNNVLNRVGIQNPGVKVRTYVLNVVKMAVGVFRRLIANLPD